MTTLPDESGSHSDTITMASVRDTTPFIRRDITHKKNDLAGDGITLPSGDTPVTDNRANHHNLTDFCSLAHREIFKFRRRRGTCIFSTAVVCDVLRRFDIKAEPLRVTARILPDERGGVGVGLGSHHGCGERRPAAKPGMWYGHLVSLVEDRYLVDTTFDQVNEDEYFKLKNAEPLVLDLGQTKWFATDVKWPNWTGNLPIFPGKAYPSGSAPPRHGRT